MKSAENLVAEVEGDIEEVDGVIRITTIRVLYRFKIPRGLREKIDAVLESHPDRCPAYVSVKNCIELSIKAEIEEEG